MCIIVAKNAGYKLPKKEILQNCFDNNSDGAGFMYVKNNHVIIDKGYMTFKSLWDRLQNLKNEINIKNTPIVLHFRIGTSGAFDGSTTHPFAITDNIDLLKKTKIKTDVAIAHNGIISLYEDRSGVLSDTQNFIKEFLYPLYEIDQNFYENEKMQNIIKNVSSSKFAILNNKNKLVTIGDFINVDGVLYSNSSYLSYKNIYNENYFNKYANYFDDCENYIDDYKKYNYNVTLDELIFLSDDEIAEGEDGDIYIPYDYRTEGLLAIDEFYRLYIVYYESNEIEPLCEFVDIMNIKDLTPSKL